MIWKALPSYFPVRVRGVIREFLLWICHCKLFPENIHAISFPFARWDERDKEATNELPGDAEISFHFLRATNRQQQADLSDGGGAHSIGYGENAFLNKFMVVLIYNTSSFFIDVL